MDINAAYIDAEPKVVAGRVGIVMGLFAFAFIYILMLVQFGWIVGVAIAWLPAGLAGWLTAVGCDSIAAQLLRGSLVPHSASSPKG